ncbi:hypothetical protein HOU02_gp378 [Caulobacter phage CcrBL9]|uniref:Uncharacterized protein n=1 Tax=Caulobacter phage CcrBL9 TaxID=2283270 RepID=A0A385EEW9_9CAUD|nr:hypothetical protein HOU02_gp378 [Caulobacter phage CcrBL9]AXQ69347.1 hypothetical protein CcrBL9_gp323 [Caulobacter phage CcrBL9]
MTDHPLVIRRDAIKKLHVAVAALTGWGRQSYHLGANALRIALERAMSTEDDGKWRYEALGFVEGTRQALEGMSDTYCDIPCDPLYAALSHARDLLRWEQPKHYDAVMTDIAPTVKALEDLARG